MKTLKEIGLETPGHSKCENMNFEDYLPVYDKFWTPIRNDNIKLLEIGIGMKGSLRMWKEYFPNGDIFGVDIDSGKLFQEERIQTFIIDQNNIESLQSLEQYSPYDIIIDDGGHVMSQQINSLCILFNFVKPGGYYIVEDVCTSYWSHFGGEYPPTKLTTMEFLKYLCDEVNKLYIGHINYGSGPNTREIPNFPVQDIKSIFFYQGVVILEKK